MKPNIMEIILKDLLLYFLGLDDESTEKHLKNENISTKERLTSIDDLQVFIFSNDHNPPHFHVKTKNLQVNAKFKIENCELISGKISSKNLKKIKAFYLSSKGQIVLKTIWNKKFNAL